MSKHEERGEHRRTKIIERYGRKNGVGHHGDCDRWRALGTCSCGLLHDLMVFDFADAVALYPVYADDFGKNERRRDAIQCLAEAASTDGCAQIDKDPPPLTYAQVADMTRRLREIFGQ